MKYTRILAGLITTTLLMPSSATASCGGLIIKLDTSNVMAGGMLKITGTGFVDGCHDVVRNGYVAPTLPGKDIRIFLVQSDHTIQIGTTDADKAFNISVTVTIPPNTPPGSASILAVGWSESFPVPLMVTAKDSAPPKDSGTK